MKKILVIDDSASVRDQVAATMKEVGFQVVEAVDGVDALAKLDDTFAMALCDVNMPRMNGLEMLEKLQSDPKYPKLPVVMLTTEGQVELIDRARAAGAKGWIVKPFKREMLIATVRKLAA